MKKNKSKKVKLNKNNKIKKIWDDNEKFISLNLENININENNIDNINHFNLNSAYSSKVNKKIYKVISKNFKLSKKYQLQKFHHISNIIKMFDNRRIPNKDNGTIYNDLFLEVESIIAYFIKNFKLSKKLYFQFELDYHNDNSLFQYLFSIFDICATLIKYNYLTKNNIDLDNNTKIYFSKPKSYISNNDDLLKNIKIIINSKSFEYLKKNRNLYSHNFSIPLFRYNFKLNLMILYINISYLIEIINNFIE